MNLCWVRLVIQAYFSDMQSTLVVHSRVNGIFYLFSSNLLIKNGSITDFLLVRK